MLKPSGVTLVLVLIAAAAARPARAAAAASPAAPTPSATPSAATVSPAPSASDALYKATSHRSFDDVDYWASVFDDPKRAEWQKPSELVAALGIRGGQSVADLGAGTGYFSRYLAAAVGERGTVFAVETEPNMVARLRERSESERTANVVPILASFDNPRLPPAAVDLVLVVDTYHHIDDRLAYLRRLARVLRRGGRIAIVDWEKRDLPVGPPMDHKLAREQVITEMESAGYELRDAPAVLPYQYVLIFAPRLGARPTQSVPAAPTSPPRGGTSAAHRHSRSMRKTIPR